MSKVTRGFIISTNSYTGNFCRELCAYVTGTIGECEVGIEESKNFLSKYGKTIITEMVMDMDNNCQRPVAPLESNDNSLIIFFNKNNMPSKNDIDIINERVLEYGKLNNIDILGTSFCIMPNGCEVDGYCEIFKKNVNGRVIYNACLEDFLGIKKEKNETKKSNYEKYCEKEQPILLQKTCDKSLEEMVILLRQFKKIYNQEMFDGMVIFVASLYDRLDSEIELLVEDKPYWLV